MDIYIYIYIYIYTGYPRAAGCGRQHRAVQWCSDVLFLSPRRCGASREQMRDFGVMGMWYSRVRQNHNDLHLLLGWKGILSYTSKGI